MNYKFTLIKYILNDIMWANKTYYSYKCHFLLKYKPLPCMMRDIDGNVWGPIVSFSYCSSVIRFDLFKSLKASCLSLPFTICVNIPWEDWEILSFSFKSDEYKLQRPQFPWSDSEILSFSFRIYEFKLQSLEFPWRYWEILSFSF